MSNGEDIFLNKKTEEKDLKKENTDELKELLKENLKYMKATYSLADKTRKYIRWLEIFAIIKFVVILIPIILAIIYLPPILKGVFDTYKDLLGFASTDILSGLK